MELNSVLFNLLQLKSYQYYSQNHSHFFYSFPYLFFIFMQEAKERKMYTSTCFTAIKSSQCQYLYEWQEHFFLFSLVDKIVVLLV